MAKTSFRQLTVMFVFSLISISQNCCNSTSIDGIWFGVITQTSPGEVYHATLIIDSRNFIYEINYNINGNPHHCGGYWIGTSGTVFQERITYGSTCINGLVNFTPYSNGTAFYQWSGNTVMTASGWFSRKTSLCY